VADEEQQQGGPEGGQGPSEEELRAQLEEEIRKVKIEDVILQSVVSILNLAARRIAKEKIAPRAAEIDESGEYPHDIFAAFKDVGLLGLSIPEAYGGSGVGTLPLALAVEEAAKVLKCAHTEAHSVLNGIAVVKLMGRHAGFIADRIRVEIAHLQAEVRVFVQPVLDAAPDAPTAAGERGENTCALGEFARDLEKTEPCDTW